MNNASLWNGGVFGALRAEPLFDRWNDGGAFIGTCRRS